MVRMGIMANMHESVQVLHIDALCQARLSTDKNLQESKSMVLAPDSHAEVL